MAAKDEKGGGFSPISPLGTNTGAPSLTNPGLPFVRMNDVVSGGIDPKGPFESLDCQHIVYKVIIHLAWLSKFADQTIREDFLTGKIGSRGTDAMLRSLDRIRELVLPFPDSRAVPPIALKGLNFLVGFFRQEETSPLDLWGHTLPVVFSYREWHHYLAELSVSPYWHSYACASNLTQAPSVSNDLYGAVKPIRVSGTKPAPLSGGVPDSSSPCPKFDRMRIEQPPDRVQGRIIPEDLYSHSGSDVERSGKSKFRMSAPHTEIINRSTSNEPKYRTRKTKRLDNYRRPLSRNQVPSSSASSDDLANSPNRSGWQAIISKINRREAVEPPIFSGKDGRSLREFFSDFEDYFETKYDGSERQKSRILLKFLSGPAKRAYEAMEGSEMQYAGLKREMLDWYQGERRSIRARSEAQFHKARMGDGETLKLFAIKLQRLAGNAFPHSPEECERQLKRRFTKSVPDRFRQVLQDNERNTAMRGHPRKLTWAEMVKLAQAEDKIRRDRREDDSCFTDEEGHMTEVNFSRPPNQVSSSATLNLSPQPYYVHSTKASDFGKYLQNGREKTSSEIPSCDWCGRRGHVPNQCWLKANLCSRCGSGDHDRVTCPKFKNPDAFVPSCPQCNGAHLGMNCPKFLN